MGAFSKRSTSVFALAYPVYKAGRLTYFGFSLTVLFRIGGTGEGEKTANPYSSPRVIQLHRLSPSPALAQESRRMGGYDTSDHDLSFAFAISSGFSEKCNICRPGPDMDANETRAAGDGK